MSLATNMSTARPFFCVLAVLALSVAAKAQPFCLPTANHALFEPGREADFFVPTPGKTWETGCFGCVRSDRHQMHEGLDIKCLLRDNRGEPGDAVMATAPGAVVYINDRPSLSNYGRYLVLRHLIGGVEVYSLYAHLHSVRSDLKPGISVQAGEPVAVMGRTSNTAAAISKDRAHVHFELNLFYSDNFVPWYKKHFPGQRNDHGVWNGENLVGFDPRLVLLAGREQGTNFDLTTWLRRRVPLCRVLVHKADVPWVKRYPMLVTPDPARQKEAVAGYEISLDYNGLPFDWIPRAAAAFKGSAKYRLLSVNEAEETQNPCRKLVRQVAGRWQLAPNGTSLLDLLTQ
jgi:murein DD-endopeptidase MepM/ murein hydrolase activator NlpD